MNTKDVIEQKKDEEKDKKKGIIIGVVGVTAAVAVALGIGLKSCAPNGSGGGANSLLVTYLTEDDVQNFQSGSLSTLKGTTIGELKKRFPSVEGYVIEGLYRDPECSEGSRFKDSDVLNEDTEVYIKFEEITITLKFHKDRNSEETVFPDISIKYYDNLKNYHLPVPSNYSTREGDYTFKNWLTKDRLSLSLDLSSGTGKDLLRIDPDGEIDFYAEFNFKEHQKYSLTVPDGVLVHSGDLRLYSGDIIYLGEQLTISAGDMGVWVLTGITLNDDQFVLGETHNVSGDVKINITACEHKYLTFKYDGSSYSVTGEKSNLDEANIVIPDTYYDGVTEITEIANYAFRYKNIETITLGKNVKKIGYEAFSGCTKLEISTLGGNIEQICDRAFMNCTNIETLIIVGHS